MMKNLFALEVAENRGAIVEATPKEFHAVQGDMYVRIMACTMAWRRRKMQD